MIPFLWAHLIERPGSCPLINSPLENGILDISLQLIDRRSVPVEFQGLSSERNFHFMTVCVWGRGRQRQRDRERHRGRGLDFGHCLFPFFFFCLLLFLPVAFYKQEHGMCWLRTQVLGSDDLILVLPFVSLEILGKLFNFSKISLHHLWNTHNDHTSLMGFLWALSGMYQKHLEMLTQFMCILSAASETIAVAVIVCVSRQ